MTLVCNIEHLRKIAADERFQNMTILEYFEIIKKSFLDEGLPHS